MLFNFLYYLRFNSFSFRRQTINSFTNVTQNFDLKNIIKIKIYYICIFCSNYSTSNCLQAFA